jgi:hypothetical protein
MLQRTAKAAPDCADKEDMDLSSIALQGLQQADAQLQQAATQIASSGAASPNGASLDTVDLSTEMIALISAQNQTAVSLSTLNVANQIQKSLIDVMA